MTTANLTGADGLGSGFSLHLGRLAGRLRNKAVQARMAIVRYLDERDARRQLAGMDERILHDIGVTRGRIDEVVRWPTDEFMARWPDRVPPRLRRPAGHRERA